MDRVVTQLSRTQIKHAAVRMLATRRGFAHVAGLAQYAATCSAGERVALEKDLNAILKPKGRQRPPSESHISNGQQVCNCRTGACHCLCIYCGDHGHSSKLCTRRVEHAAPPEVSSSWLGAARTAAAVVEAPTRKRFAADEHGAALPANHSLSRGASCAARDEITDAQQQREAERLVTHSMLKLRDELKAVSHCAALKRVSELADAITWEAPPPCFWPTSTRTTAAKNAVANALAALTDHAKDMGLDGARATPPITVGSGKYRPITPDIVDCLSRPPRWPQEESRNRAGSRAHELLLAQQSEYAAVHSEAQEQWFEHYRVAVGKFAPRQSVERARQADTDLHTQLLEDKLRGIFADETQKLDLVEALSIWGSDGVIQLDRTCDGSRTGGDQPTIEAAPSQNNRGKLSRQRSSKASFRRLAVRNVQAAIHEHRLVGEMPLVPAAKHAENAQRQELANWLSKNGLAER